MKFRTALNIEANTLGLSFVSLRSTSLTKRPLSVVRYTPSTRGVTSAKRTSSPPDLSASRKGM